MRKIVITLLLIVATLLSVFGMVSCDKEKTKTDDPDKIVAPSGNDPSVTETVHTVSSELWSSAFEADNYTYMIADGNPANTVKVDGPEIAIYYSDNSVQYLSKNIGGQVIVKYFSKSGDSSQKYNPGEKNYNDNLLAYNNIRDFALINFEGFFDRFTYDETKEAYVFDGAADSKTLSSNVILKNANCKYSHVEVSFDNGNLTKINAVDSKDGKGITLSFTNHGTTSIDID